MGYRFLRIASPHYVCFFLPRVTRFRFISDALGHPPLLSISTCAVELPRCAGPSLPADEADSDQDEDEENLGIEGSGDIVEAYHGARYRYILSFFVR